jgi:lysylphosphatidylglycerol synthetase-like protein (DUF2156 family)
MQGVIAQFNWLMDNPTSWQYIAISAFTLCIYSALMGFLFASKDSPEKSWWTVLFFGVLSTLFWPAFWGLALVAGAVIVLIAFPVKLGSTLSKRGRK